MKTGKSWLWKVGVSVFAFAMVGVAANAGVISAGNYDSFGVKADNSVLGWGWNADTHLDYLITQDIIWKEASHVADAQLGLGPTNTMAKMNGQFVVVAPTQLGTAKTWVDVVGGASRGFGIQSDGSLWGWGYDGMPTATYLSGGAGNDSCLDVYHYEQGGALGMAAPLCQVISVVYTNPVISVTTNSLSVSGTDILTYKKTTYSAPGIYTQSVMNGLASNQPVEVGTVKTWRQIAAGGTFGLGLQADGSIWSWGSESKTTTAQYGTNVWPTGYVYSADGQLGQGDMLVTLTNSAAGYSRSYLYEYYTNMGGGVYTLYLTTTSTTTYAATTNVRYYARAINTPTKITAASMVYVAAGSAHSAAVGVDGSLWTWGKNQGTYTATATNDGYSWYYGSVTGCVLGLGDTTLIAANVPTRVGSETTWASVSAGLNARSTMAIKKDGSLWSWGNNGATYAFDWINGSNVFRAYALGSLGLGSNTMYANVPTRVGTDNNWAIVSVGGYHGLGLKSDGSLYAWGYNYYGQVGVGRDDQYVAVPTRVGVDNDWVAVSAGAYHSLALKSDGSLWGWGNNYYAALGDQEGDAYEPIKIGDGWGASVPVIAASENGGGDYDGDGCTDFVIYDASTGNWQVRLSLMGYTLLPLNAMLGGPGYRLVTGDFDGDGVTDPAVYQESSGTWKVMLSGSSYALETTVFGGSGFTAVPADYDGDGSDGYAVYNKTTGDWYIRLSDSGITIMKNSVGAGCVPLPMDYDGDGEADLATYESATGKWQVELSRYDNVVAKFWFGDHNYLPVPMDYDGDGLADPAVYGEATGVWGIRLSKYDWMTYYSAIYGWTLGGTGYIPTPADYDGDGLADMTVYSLTTGQWTIMLSRSAYYRVTTQW